MKKKHKAYVTLCVLACISMLAQAQEYLYPVGHIYQDGFKLLLLYQKSAHHVELWQWDPVTQEAGKALLSSFTPAGIAQLPDDLGYSFIDNDTIRVARTAKRSAQLIPLYEPLYDFTMIQWITQDACILSAKEHERYGIYAVTIDGNCIDFLHDAQVDYRYPVVLDTTMYYIHIKDGVHSIMSAQLPQALCSQEDFLLTERIKGDLTHITNLITYDKQCCAFLTIFNAHEGAYLEYPSIIERHAQTITFNYHYISNLSGSWQDISLFSFSIPASFLIDAHDRLHESILPFLPKRIDNILYYFDYSPKTQNALLMACSLQTHQLVEYTLSDQPLMGIYTHGNDAWHGGALVESASTQQCPQAWVGDDGLFLVHLPKLPIT